MSKIITYSFCESFVDNLTRDVVRDYARGTNDLSRLAVVFGGKRPALFVKKKLAETLGQSFIPPRFFTIDEFISMVVRQHESFTTPNDLDHCYLLYQLAQARTPHILRGREKFSEFLPWTREILGFIDQLDLEHIPDDKLKAIESNARIGYAVPPDINRLLESMVALRQAYHQTMTDWSLYSRGFQYLRAAELIKVTDWDDFDQILFCNFFYFNRSEEAVVKHLYERDKATLIFQGDERKWPVLRRIAQRFNTALYETEEPTLPPVPDFDLHLYAGTDGHTQVGLAHRVLRQIPQKDNTVIVIPDTRQLVPLLSVINNDVRDYNISMGYPLRRSSLYSLFEYVAKAQSTRKPQGYYAKDYLKVMRHPFIKNLNLFGSPTVARVLIHKIEEILSGQQKTSISGSSFVPLEAVSRLDDLYVSVKEMLQRLNLDETRQTLQAGLERIHALLFDQWARVRHFADFAQALGALLDALVDHSFMRFYPLNLNIASAMFAIKEELASSSFNQEILPQEELFRIFESKVAQEKVAFLGSPLKGLQVLGLAETRSLNFDHVLILDANEGLLPQLRIHEALIPREVMISLGLDRLEMEEEIQRYQFMRLISSAKQVHLVYEQSREKERSRFVEELVWEAQKKSQQIEAVPVTRGHFHVKIAPERKEAKKTPEVIGFLKKMTYSASSLNMYVRNPLEFYTTYVLGLREPDDLLDDPEARHVGLFLHELLEDSFRPYLGRAPVFNEKFMKRFLKLFEDRFQETFAKTMRSDAFLLRSVLLERLTRFWDNERNNPERAVKEILFLEERLGGSISLNAGDFQFRYMVDRMDRLRDGSLLVVDYKTGLTDVMPRGFEALLTMELSRQSIRDLLKSFQLPLYLYFLGQQFPGEKVNAALYNLRTLDVKPFITDKLKCPRETIHRSFLRCLNFIMDEILNPEINFIDDQDASSGF